jgi:hypothetical protein
VVVDIVDLLIKFVVDVVIGEVIDVEAVVVDFVLGVVSTEFVESTEFSVVVEAGFMRTRGTFLMLTRMFLPVLVEM